MTLFDIYATDEIKTKAVDCIRLFQIPMPSENKAKEQLKTQVLDALRELSEAVRRDLGLDTA